MSTYYKILCCVLLNVQFAIMYSLIDWPADFSNRIPQSKQNLLLFDREYNQNNYTNLNEFIESSELFPIKFPIDTGRCKTLRTKVSESTLLRNINSAYPILHEHLISLFVDFILHKRKFGSNIEKKFYKDMNLLDLIERLLKKRAVEFVGSQDSYKLLDGTTGSGSWEKIGKDVQEHPLTLENYLSYDEIKLSAFLSVSSYTYFINDGSRHNAGRVSSNRENLQEEGIIIGLIGTRLEKKYYMEYQDIVIEEKQNVEGNGYGTTFAPTMASLFAGFYEKRSWTYENFFNYKESNRSDLYTKVGKKAYFDNIAYSKRIALSIDTLLFEANHRARERRTTAYVHIVGIGLGVWILSDHQKDVFLETFVKRVKYLGNYLHNISDLHFAYFSRTEIGGKYRNGSVIPIESHPQKGIKIYISQRQPHEALVSDNKGKLLVVSYAWDGNALPGNDYWSGNLDSSGDSAAASSTQIAEIHNPHINRKVHSSNLMIASRGVVYPFQEYVQKMKSHNNTEHPMLQQFDKFYFYHSVIV